MRAILFVPKHRAMTRSQWKAMDSLLRRIWRDQDMERKIHESYLDLLIYGTCVMPEITMPLTKPNFSR